MKQTADPLRHRYDNWMRLNPGAERQDVTTDAKGFQRCEHEFADRIGKSDLIKCRHCYKLKEIERVCAMTREGVPIATNGCTIAAGQMFAKSA